MEHTQIYSSLHHLYKLDLRLMMGVQGLYDLQTPALQSDFPVKQWRELILPINSPAGEIRVIEGALKQTQTLGLQSRVQLRLSQADQMKPTAFSGDEIHRAINKKGLILKFNIRYGFIAMLY